MYQLKLKCFLTWHIRLAQVLNHPHLPPLEHLEMSECKGVQLNARIKCWCASTVRRGPLAMALQSSLPYGEAWLGQVCFFLLLCNLLSSFGPCFYPLAASCSDLGASLVICFSCTFSSSFNKGSDWPKWVRRSSPKKMVYTSI